MLLPKHTRIIIINKPINARLGIPGMMNLLFSNAFELLWDGVEPITVVAFNLKQRMCKILTVDDNGITCSNRVLRQGRFQYMLRHELIPTAIRRCELEALLQEGTIKRFNRQKL
ncbi:hypothetical protein [Anaerobiospirillum sp. NML120449]|uniref:hypothetical protein n=1 Tax=Anaerobiospirillum sp. NML120449 TaxID=2932817 RepID=UPI001FF51BAC|nr:hypothetical protein [Anaerobiospirillum sp. NML120449]MCK0527699.1 hypothetical protein [Anaerobiospirillum sp. NML120449]